MAVVIMRRWKLCGGSIMISRTRTLNFQKANFSLFKGLLRGIPRGRALEEKGLQESWSILSVPSSKLKTSVFS